MLAKSDPHDYGDLQVFVMPRDRQVDGPAIVNARINQEPEVSQLITLLSRAGSEVLQGNLLIIPIEQSLVYIRPLYVQATGANAVPELKKVIVAFGDRIAIHDTLQAALTAVFGDAPRRWRRARPRLAGRSRPPTRAAASWTRRPAPSPTPTPRSATATPSSTCGSCRRAAACSTRPARPRPDPDTTTTTTSTPGAAGSGS